MTTMDYPHGKVPTNDVTTHSANQEQRLACYGGEKKIFYILKSKPRNGRLSNKNTETCFPSSPRHCFVHLSIETTHYDAYQDTHPRGYRNVQNDPSTVQNMYKWQRNGRYLLRKRSKEISIYAKTGEVHQFSYSPDTAINPTQYEAGQKTNSIGV